MDSVAVTPTAARATARDYLDTLNAQQRAAVEYGIASDAASPGALLIIAGAGSGKTNTLAYRVAHVVRSGADPFRLLLLTFSRRSAAEMEQRTGRILNIMAGRGAGQTPTSLPWAGTFHSVGARLLREYAERIGLHASFTIQDRGDSGSCAPYLMHWWPHFNSTRRFA